jgi:hypothetical protein
MVSLCFVGGLMGIFLKALLLSSFFSYGAASSDPLRDAELENTFVGSYQLADESLGKNTCSGVVAGQTYYFTTGNPSGFDVLRRADSVSKEGETIQVSKDIQLLSESDQIVITQTTIRSHVDGRDVGIQMITMLPKSFQRGEVGVNSEITPVIYVKYQYITISYSPTGLIEKMNSSQECTFKKLP